MGFSRQEYWRGLPFPPPKDPPDPGIELAPFTSPALVGGFFTTASPGEGKSVEPLTELDTVCMSIDKNYFTLLLLIFNLQSCKSAQGQ